MSDVLFYGSSDDLIEVEGDVPGCDEYPAEDVTFVVSGPAGRVRVRLTYDGCWAATVGRDGEDVPMLPVDVTAHDAGYSVHVVVHDADVVIPEATF